MLVGLKNQNVYRNAFAILHFDSADTILTQDIHSVCGYSIKMRSNYLVGSTHVNKGKSMQRPAGIYRIHIDRPSV
jgi:hypothetical protein